VLLVGHQISTSTRRAAEAKANVLLERCAPNDPPLPDAAMYTPVGHRQASTVTDDARADGGAVGLDANQFSARIQSLPWPGSRTRAARCASPGVAPPTSKTMSSSPSLIEVRKRTPWPLCSSPVPEDCGHVDERRPPFVAQQQTRDERRVRRVAGAEIEIEEAVVVDVAEVGAHHHQHLVQSQLSRVVS
jgi:hypothetical protein